MKLVKLFVAIIVAQFCLSTVFAASVAEINGVQYESLQDAVNNAKDGDTVVLLTDCSENITYTQTPDTEENPGVKFTIDGDGKTMTGKITINSSVVFSEISDKIGLTIKNVNFTTENNSLIFIDASTNRNHYKCNLTIENCSFEGPSSNSSVVPVKTYFAVNLQMIDCVAKGVNSLFQSAGNGIGYTFIRCKVTESGRGIFLDSVEGEVLIKDCEINALNTKYGIRLDGDALRGYNITIEDSSIDAFIPVCVRNASQNGLITFKGENTITQRNTDGIWCAIGTSEYDSNGVLPTAPTGQVVVTLNDTGLSMDGVYGNYVAPPENDVFDDIIAGNINIEDEAAADVKVKIMGFADVVGGSEKVAAYFSEVYGSAKAPASAVLATTGDLFKISEYFSLPLLAKAPTVSVAPANSAYGTVAFCFTLVDGDNDIYVTASTKVKQLIKYVEKLEDDFICDENELDITFADGMIKVDFKNSDKPSGFIKVDFTVPSVN